MIGIAMLIVLMFICSRVGAYILRLIRLRSTSSLEQGVYSVGIGLLVLANSVLVLGVVGGLYAEVFWGIIVLLGVFALYDVRRVLPELHHARRALPNLAAYSGVEKLLLLGLGLFAFVYLLVALAPPAFGYGIHVYWPIAQQYVRSHEITFIPYWFAMRPQNMTLFYTAGLLLSEEFPLPLLNYGISLLTLLLLYTTAARWMSRKYALLAAVIWYTTPLIRNISTTISAEIGVAFFGLLAFCAFLQWWESQRAQWILLAGLCSGFGAGFKIIGVEIPVVLGLLIVCRGWRHGRAGVARLLHWQKARAGSPAWPPFKAIALAAVLFAGATIITGFAWYYLVYTWTGTPLCTTRKAAPFVQRYLALPTPAPQAPPTTDGSDSASQPREAAVQTKPPPQTPEAPTRQAQKNGMRAIIAKAGRLIVRRGPIQLAQAAWDMSMIQDVQGDVITPLYLVFIPLLLLFPVKNQRIYIFVVFTLLYCAIGVNLWGRYNRYIIAVFPVASVVVGYVVANLRQTHKNLARFSLLACGLMVCLYVPATIHSGINHFPYALGLADQEAYLERKFPGSYTVARYVNTHLPESSKTLMVGEYRTFLFQRESILGSFAGLFVSYQDFRNPDNLYQRLQLLDITHVILNKQSASDTGNVNSGYADKHGYVENFKNKYLQYVYHDSDVFLYQLKTMNPES